MLKLTQRAAIDRLADIRQQTATEIIDRFTLGELIAAPKSFSSHIKSMYNLPVVESGVDDGMPFVRLESGRIFFGHMPAASHRRQYLYVNDRLPQAICEDAFLIALDVAVRYVNMKPRPPAEIAPPRDGLMIECGAYLGHKTIFFADELVPDGHIVAIEMIPENVKVLRKNIEANGLAERITVAPYGVWDENSTLKLYSKGWQKNSLVDIGRLDASTIDVPVRRIETILEELGLADAAIDFIYVTVNGAEYHCLQGLGTSWDRLRAAFVVSAYEVAGESNNARCRRILAEHGLTVLDIGRPHLISAKRQIE